MSQNKTIQVTFFCEMTKHRLTVSRNLDGSIGGSAVKSDKQEDDIGFETFNDALLSSRLVAKCHAGGIFDRNVIDQLFRQLKKCHNNVTNLAQS